MGKKNQRWFRETLLWRWQDQTGRSQAWTALPLRQLTLPFTHSPVSPPPDFLPSALSIHSCLETGLLFFYFFSSSCRWGGCGGKSCTWTGADPHAGEAWFCKSNERGGGGRGGPCCFQLESVFKIIDFCSRSACMWAGMRSRLCGDHELI